MNQERLWGDRSCRSGSRLAEGWTWRLLLHTGGAASHALPKPESRETMTLNCAASLLKQLAARNASNQGVRSLIYKENFRRRGRDCGAVCSTVCSSICITVGASPAVESRQLGRNAAVVVVPPTSQLQKPVRVVCPPPPACHDPPPCTVCGTIRGTVLLSLQNGAHFEHRDVRYFNDLGEGKWRARKDSNL